MSKAIPEGWKRQKLIEVAQPISYGIKPFEGYRTYIATADLNGHGIIGGVPVTYENRPSRADLELGNGNVIFARMKETAKVFEVLNRTDKFIFSTGFAGFRSQTDLVSGFLKQFFLSKEFNRLKDSLCTGSTQMAITSDGIEQIDILLPPPHEQHKIAAILGSVDKAIEKTRAVIEQTRSLKRAMMQELFTRGSPGRHKKFKKTPVGEIPEEWDVVRLGDIAHVQTGIAKNAKNRPENMIKAPYLRVANVQDGYVDLSEIKHIEMDSESIERYLLRKGDVLFNEGGDNDKLGRGCVWEAQISPCLHQNHVFAVRCSSKLTPYYLATYAASPKGKEFFLSSAKQTTNLASINSTQLKAFAIPLPPIREQQDIMDMFRQLDNRLSADAAVLDGLGQMKDALMQNLLSGKIRVEKED